MDYTGFTAQDFLLDDYFQNWVLQPNPENEKFWQNWLRAYPNQQHEVEKARNLLLSLDFKPAVLPAEKVNRLWQHIEARTQTGKVVQLVPDKKTVATTRINWYRIAAVFICVLFAGLALWKFQETESTPIRVATSFGEIRTITLPDNSKVVLNGNSVLSYASPWDASSVREVKLQGEAYFSVTHTRNHQPFRVQASDGVKVEVLGTKFVLTNRPQKTRVVLSEGKVKVAVADAHQEGNGSPQKTEAIMKPGELVELGPGSRLNKITVHNPALYSAFLQHKIVFVDTPLSEVARVLKDTYGYQVTFADPALATRRFTGSGNPKKIDLLLTAIEKSFRLTIEKKGRHITIKPA
ncbi:anti-sigma factor [Adhaeribacter aerolatus]|uniref:Anti-sigma factor n=1 Tax=Adhaeribacter aerolatus TaxID=670289 RepID=A0A512AV26_9BACT|nr:FecR domain-containing protein [Adhaeribacter aerolatus]GEO03576.1 anti-sigma factor [Adhaeribacter aerolatus]